MKLSPMKHSKSFRPSLNHTINSLSPQKNMVPKTRLYTKRVKEKLSIPIQDLTSTFSREDSLPTISRDLRFAVRARSSKALPKPDIKSFATTTALKLKSAIMEVSNHFNKMQYNFKGSPVVLRKSQGEYEPKARINPIFYQKAKPSKNEEIRTNEEEKSVSKGQKYLSKTLATSNKKIVKRWHKPVCKVIRTAYQMPSSIHVVRLISKKRIQ